MSEIYEKRWYQEEALFSIFDYFDRGNRGNPLVLMPTGTGKSHVIADFIKIVFQRWPTQRIMMLTHVKKLIEQNAEKLMSVWPVAPLGIHSAGLNSKDMIQPIVYGGIQSVAKSIEKAEKERQDLPAHLRHFGWRDVIVIDEAHLISPEENTQYRYTIDMLMRINPNLVVIGFTATGYRLKQGRLTDEGGIFTDICYDITGIEAFNRLIAEGYLAPLIPRPTSVEIDRSAISMSQGEFNSKQSDCETTRILEPAIKETIFFGQDRLSWLLFTPGVESAEIAASMLQSFGIDACAVHSKLGEKENDRRIRAFQLGEYRALVNSRKLTTGFDHPPIDLIADLQPSMSASLHVQKWGRGTRPSPTTGKRNCLGLDFARNIFNLGPINDPLIPAKPGKAKAGEAPVRICEQCGTYNHAAARFCICCGMEFKFESKLFASAGTAELIRSDIPEIEYFEVQKVIYNLHEKKTKDGMLMSPPSIKVSYFCGLRMFNEYVCLEHQGLPGKKARDWWRQRHAEEPPPTTFAALQKVSQLRPPARIRVHVNTKYPEILSAEW